MTKTEDYSITRAREQIYDALRFLNPSEAERILSEMARDMKKLADRYDQMLLETIC